MLRIHCDPDLVDLPAVAVGGGKVVLTRWSPPPGRRLRPGQPVDLTDGRVVVLATLARRGLRGRWTFTVRPLKDPARSSSAAPGPRRTRTTQDPPSP